MYHSGINYKLELTPMTHTHDKHIPPLGTWHRRGILVANHGLLRRRISVAERLRGIDDGPQLLLLLVGQIDILRCPVLLQPPGLGSSGDGNHALGRDPSEGDLGRGAAPALG